MNHDIIKITNASKDMSPKETCESTILGAKIYIAAIAEYLCAEFCDLLNMAAATEGDLIINSNHLTNVLEKNAELKEMVYGNQSKNAKFMG
jgi:hypothetical protein